jgi:hypothetical protein
MVGSVQVGKTVLSHLVCKGEVLPNSSYTVGCSTEVKVRVRLGPAPFSLQRSLMTMSWPCVSDDVCMCDLCVRARCAVRVHRSTSSRDGRTT